LMKKNSQEGTDHSKREKSVKMKQKREKKTRKKVRANFLAQATLETEEGQEADDRTKTEENG